MTSFPLVRRAPYDKPLNLTGRSTRPERPPPRKLLALSAGESAARALWRRLSLPRPALVGDPRRLRAGPLDGTMRYDLPLIATLLTVTLAGRASELRDGLREDVAEYINADLALCIGLPTIGGEQELFYSDLRARRRAEIGRLMRALELDRQKCVMDYFLEFRDELIWQCAVMCGPDRSSTICPLLLRRMRSSMAVYDAALRSCPAPRAA